MTCRIQTALVAGLILALTGVASVRAATWNNSQADGDINNAANWGGTFPSDATGEGAIVGATPLVINQVFSNGGDNRSQYLITGVGGMTVAAGGSFTYLGDGLLGSTVGGAGGGASTITHTGGTLTQDGGGAGCLIGHNRVGTYNISGGNLYVQGAAPTLTVDFNDSGPADPDADGSSLNISGTGRVDVETDVDLVVNAGGTLNVTGDGLLVWHDRTVGVDSPGAGTINALATQVGSDIHYMAFPPITDGTVIGVDFGPTAPLGNYNQYDSTAGGTIPANSMVDTSGSVVGGVSLTVTAPAMWSNDDAADSTDLPGQPAFFDDTHLTDWIGEGTGGGADIDLTFSGLDDSLIYELVIGSGFTVGATDTDTDWTVDGQTKTSVHDVGASAYVTFSDLTTDGSGNLVITSDPGAGSPNITVVSALRLTASAPAPKGTVIAIK